MADVRQAIALGNEEFKILPVEFVRGILEQLASLFAGEQDGPCLIDDERGICLGEDTF